MSAMREVCFVSLDGRTMVRNVSSTLTCAELFRVILEEIDATPIADRVYFTHRGHCIEASDDSAFAMGLLEQGVPVYVQGRIASLKTCSTCST
jgi:hypothetical protein